MKNEVQYNGSFPTIYYLKARESEREREGGDRERRERKRDGSRRFTASRRGVVADSANQGSCYRSAAFYRTCSPVMARHRPDWLRLGCRVTAAGPAPGRGAAEQPGRGGPSGAGARRRPGMTDAEPDGSGVGVPVPAAACSGGVTARTGTRTGGATRPASAPVTRPTIAL